MLMKNMQFVEEKLSSFFFGSSASQVFQTVFAFMIFHKQSQGEDCGAHFNSAKERIAGLTLRFG